MSFIKHLCAAALVLLVASGTAHAVLSEIKPMPVPSRRARDLPVAHDAGGVRCWGANNGGQLGDTSLKSHGVATEVWGLSSGVVAIALSRGAEYTSTIGGGAHACAVMQSGTCEVLGNQLAWRVG
jgi:hypothetical protein